MISHFSHLKHDCELQRAFAREDDQSTNLLTCTEEYILSSERQIFSEYKVIMNKKNLIIINFNLIMLSDYKTTKHLKHFKFYSL